MNLADLIFQIANRNRSLICEVCRVTKVDDFTCDVESLLTDADLPGVRLKADSASDEGIIIKPAVDSYVLVVYLTPTDAFVAMADQIDEIWVKISDTTVKINKDEIVINGGDNKGLVKVEKLVERLNNVEDDVNNLKTVFSSWVPVPQDGGAALKTAAGTWFGTQLQKTETSQVENEKVKH